MKNKKIKNILTMKYKIIKPSNGNWKELGKILNDLTYETRKMLNKTSSICMEFNGFSTFYKDKYDLFCKEKDILERSLFDHCVKNIPYIDTLMGSRMHSAVIKSAVDKWNSDFKDVQKGLKRVPQYSNNDSPIFLDSQAFKIYCDNINYYLSATLINPDHAISLGRVGCKKGIFECVLQVTKGTQKSIIDKCIGKEYKICGSKIKKEGNDWYLLLAYDLGEIKKSESKNIMGIDMGIVYPIYFSINESEITNEYKGYVNGKIEGGEIENLRKSVEGERRSLQKQLKYCSDNRHGHGKNTLLAPVTKIGNKVSMFQKSVNHKYSKYIIDEAIKNKCYLIQMEDLSGIGKSSKFLRNWSYFSLQTDIEYKAKMAGIEVVKINPMYTSQRCSKCGSIHDGNRPKDKKGQAYFKCVSCGLEINADRNASINISIIGIDDIIEKEANRLGLRYKKKAKDGEYKEVDTFNDILITQTF